jgi:ribosomal protein S18 acetylase RimI-like enzyme
MARLAAIARMRGCPRLDWLVTHDNPAVGFYRSLGAGHMNDWHFYRLRGENLEALADEAGQGLRSSS